LSQESRRMAGILLVLLPTVMIGGISLLSMLLWEPAYAANPLRQNLWRAGHAHAGVLLILSLVMLRYVDDTRLSQLAKWFIRIAAPTAAILMPVAFFVSVLSPAAREPNGLIYLAYAGAAVLAAGVITLGVGLLKEHR
jgi:drug/metabolite transporter superfamily protein YnfA